MCAIENELYENFKLLEAPSTEAPGSNWHGFLFVGDSADLLESLDLHFSVKFISTG